jgi:hypothetical protein
LAEADVLAAFRVPTLARAIGKVVHSLHVAEFKPDGMVLTNIALTTGIVTAHHGELVAGGALTYTTLRRFHCSNPLDHFGYQKPIEYTPLLTPKKAQVFFWGRAAPSFAA